MTDGKSPSSDDAQPDGALSDGARPEGPSNDSDTGDFVESDEALLAGILEDYLSRIERGETPDCEQLKREHPQLADQLDDCLAGLAFIQSETTAAGPSANAADVAENRELGDFRIGREVGRGGMGAVYEAEQISLGRRVALKVLRFGAVSDPQALERFQREAETVAKLHHTNIVPTFAVGCSRGINYYAMQFIDGKSLDQVMKASDEPIDADRVADWGLQAAEALEHAHRRGVIHRDVKPSNLILDEDNRIWLTDFGLAKRQDDVTLSRTGAILGTPRYMSPEQASSSAQSLDHRTDIYSLGATLYELLTGKPPFTADSPHEVISQILSDDPPAPRSVHPKSPRDMETIILKCLAKERSHRYETMKEVSDDLRAFSERRPIRARRASMVEQAARWLQRRRRTVTSGATVASATALMIVIIALTWAGVYYANQGQLMLTTHTPPLSAHFLDDRRAVESSHTAPTQTPISIQAGRRKMVVAAAKSWGRESWVSIDAGQVRLYDLSLDHQEFAPAIQVDLSYALVRQRGGVKIYGMDKLGIRKLPVKGTDEVDWQSLLAHPENRPGGETLRKEKPNPDEPPWPAWPWAFQHAGGSGLGPFDDRPYIVGGIESEQYYDAEPVTAPDLNGDGVSDLIVAARHQAWVQAISGRDGELLWKVFRGDPQFSKRSYWQMAGQGGWQSSSTVTSMPLLLGDLDDDGVKDLGVSFASVDQMGAVVRWVEAVSGADGGSLWKLDLPAPWFNTLPNQPAPYRFSWSPHNQDRHGTSGNDLSSGQGDRVHRRPPSPSVHMSGSHQVNSRMQLTQFDGRPAIVFFAGDQLVVVNPETGERHDARALPSMPTSNLRLANLDGDEHPDFVFLTESKSTQPRRSGYNQSQLCAWSGTQQRIVWTRQLQACWPTTHGLVSPDPRWPLVRDVDGDGQHEVVAATGSSFTGGGNWNITPWGEVTVFNGSDGDARWKSKVLNKDQQLSHIEVGPDIDGDGHRDVFTAAIWGRNGEIWVDALSGANGETLWSRSQHNPQFGDRTRDQITDILFRRRDRGEPDELIVLTGPTNYGNYEECLAVAFDVRRGVVTGTMSHSPTRMHCVDLDQDGPQETIAYYSADYRRGLGIGGDLHISRGHAGERWSQVGAQPTVVGDLNGDGVRDLVTAYGSAGRRAISGLDGRVLWERELRHVLGMVALSGNQHRILSIGDPATETPDIDGDGRTDLVFAAYPNHQQSATCLFAVSGATGRPLWALEETVRIARSTPILQARDLDNNGRQEIIMATWCDWGVVRQPGMASPRQGQLWLAVVDGKSGRLRWRKPLEPAASNFGQIQKQARLLPAYGDFNGDGVEDILTSSLGDSELNPCQWTAFDGKTGEVLFTKKYRGNVRHNHLRSVPPPAVGDLDGDGLAEAVFLQLEPAPSRSFAESVATLEATNGAGDAIWSWTAKTDRQHGVVHYKDDWYRNGIRPQLIRGPKNKLLVNLMLNKPSDNRTELLLLDHEGQLIAQKKLEGKVNYSTLTTWPCDTNGDGVDELLAFDDRRTLQCLAVGDEPKTLWSFSLKSSNHVRVINVASDSSRVALMEGYDNNDVYVIDTKTGKMLWRGASPKPRAKNGGKISINQASVLSPMIDDTAPVVFYQWGNHAIVRDMQVAQGDLAAHRMDRSQWRGRKEDARWLKSLPWASNLSFSDAVKEMRTLAFAVLIGLTMGIAPIWYTLRLVAMRRFGLSAFMLIFVIVGVFLSVAHLPFNQIPVGVGQRLLVALSVSPPILLLFATMTWIINRQWRPLAVWLGITLMVVAAVTLIAIAASWISANTLPGERYSLAGAWFVIFPGLYLVSYAYAIQLVGAGVFQAMLGRRARQSPSLRPSIGNS